MARLLVVDDDPAGLEIRRLILERRGHTPVIASSPAEARAQFSAAAFDAIVLDLRLPEAESGLALLREFAGAKIIVLCGNPADLDGREEARLASAVLQKPVRAEVLLHAIEQVQESGNRNPQC